MFGKKKSKKCEQKATVAATAATSGILANQTASKTETFNKECESYRISLRAENDRNSTELMKKLDVQPDYVGDRQKAVSMTWKYEQADVAMGGKGSAHLSAAERAELLNTGKIRGCEVHHINSVAEHPELQTSADNGRIYRSHSEHMHEGHNGDFRNPSEGPLIDRDAMLLQTNRKRVVKNEAMGAGTAAVIGAATGVASSVVATCKEEGVSFKSVKKGVNKSGKPAFISSVTSLLTYTLTRGIKYIFKL